MKGFQPISWIAAALSNPVTKRIMLRKRAHTLWHIAFATDPLRVVFPLLDTSKLLPPEPPTVWLSNRRPTKQGKRYVYRYRRNQTARITEVVS